MQKRDSWSLLGFSSVSPPRRPFFLFHLVLVILMVKNNEVSCGDENKDDDGHNNNEDDDIDVDVDVDDDGDVGDDDDAHLLLFSPQLPFPVYSRCSSTLFQGPTTSDRPFANKIRFKFTFKDFSKRRLPARLLNSKKASVVIFFRNTPEVPPLPGCSDSVFES